MRRACAAINTRHDLSSDDQLMPGFFLQGLLSKRCNLSLHLLTRGIWEIFAARVQGLKILFSEEIYERN